MEDSLVNKTNKMFKFTALSMALVLAACGGGGGDGVDSVKPEIPNGGGNGGSSEPGLGAEVSAVNVSDIVLLDVDGNTTRTINRNGVTAKVTVTDGANNPIASSLVTFSGENVVFGSSNNSVITNANGEAVISVAPTSNTDTGSYTLRASASYGGLNDTSNDYFYSIQAVNVGLTDLQVAKSNLETGDSTLVTLKTIDQTTGVFANDVTVNFSATCGSFDNSTVSSSNQGNVSTTYKAIDDNGQLCEGTHAITASTPSGTTAPLQRQVNIAAISATSIVYTTAEGMTLGAKSSGSASTSQVVFTIYSNGTPAANQQVNINLLRAPADFSFIRNGNRTNPQTLTSDASGQVLVTVYPGDIPGPVELKASLKSEPTVFALSKKLAVATGRPTQNGITLAVGQSVLQNAVISSTDITAYLTDRQGNFVPAGTVVSFIAEGGTVTPSCATDAAGRCSVTFTSQNPRPTNGRVSVLAFVEGDKDFVDVNGDNTYTAGVDRLTSNIGTLFRDDNENSQYDEGEFQYSRALLGAAATCGPSAFTQPNRPETCDDVLDAILRQQIVMGFADSAPTLVNESFNETHNQITFDMYGNSSRTLPMPSGTTVSLVVEDRTENNNAECKAELVRGFEEVPGYIDLKRVYMNGNNLVNGFLNSPVVKYSADVAGCSAADKIELNVTAPNSGVIKTRINSLISASR